MWTARVARQPLTRRNHSFFAMVVVPPGYFRFFESRVKHEKTREQRFDTIIVCFGPHRDCGGGGDFANKSELIGRLFVSSEWKKVAGEAVL